MKLTNGQNMLDLFGLGPEAAEQLKEKMADEYMARLKAMGEQACMEVMKSRAYIDYMDRVHRQQNPGNQPW